MDLGEGATIVFQTKINLEQIRSVNIHLALCMEETGFNDFKILTCMSKFVGISEFFNVQILPV